MIYTAAHGGFAQQGVPLGGGAAVYEMLIAEWARTNPFSLRTITPAILGPAAPTGQQLVQFKELQYARFSRQFEQAATAAILQCDPRSTVVLINDVSEGPSFARLAAAGFPLFTIYHVDVVAYVASIYLRGLLSPRTANACYEAIPRLLRPDLLGLIFDKQRASVEHSRKLILPSSGMAAVMRHTYPWLDAAKCEAMPWGVNLPAFTDSELDAEAVRLREEFALGGAQVLLALSRISPEKGQDTLLEALQKWAPAREVVLIICGEAAFMMGQRFLQRLHALATQMKNVRVIFPGYVQGLRKQAFFRLADLYVFPSRHESYGLTMLEAMAAGLPVICFDHLGAREVMRPEFGAMLPAGGDLRPVIEHWLADPSKRKAAGAAARTYAQAHSFEATARRLAAMLSAAI